MTPAKKHWFPLAVFLSCTLLSPACHSAPSMAPAAEESASVQEEARTDFPARLPGKLKRKAVAKANWQISPAYDQPLLPESENADQVTILGEAEATQGQMVQFIQRRNPSPQLNCTVPQIVELYYQEAGSEGVRADIALCQALKETGFFAYGGDVLPEQNNYCGLGATGNHVRGAYFPTPQQGVRAHIQHLMAYATIREPSQDIVDPRYEHIRQNRRDLYGKSPFWTNLNGTWAVPGTYYGQDILNLWRQAVAPDDSAEAMRYANLTLQRRDSAYNYIYRGIAFAAQGSWEEAIHDYTEALQRESSVEAYYDRALCYERQGKDDAAISDYTAAISENPKFPQSRYNRGLLYLRQKKYEAAIQDFEELLRLIPQSAAARNNIGVAHIQLKDYEAAWQDFHAAGEINTNHPETLANQATITACLKKKH